MIKSLPFQTQDCVLGLGQAERRARVQRAAMLAAILTGASPVGGNYPVATVAITGDGAGDQTVESPVVKILEGWV